MENWRGFLNEGIHPKIRKKINDLLVLRNEGGAVGISVHELANSVQFHYSWIFPGGEKSYIIPSKNSRFGKQEDYGIPENLPYGQVVIHKRKIEEEGPCSDAYVIQYTMAESGWGPLLYEVALEWASAVGTGLTPDRFTVSKAASSVWDKYLQRSDVSKDQLDIAHDKRAYGYDIQSKYDQLTPDNENDDCQQIQSINFGGDQWADTPHSKLYRKNNTEIIDALSMLGRWKTK